MLIPLILTDPHSVSSETLRRESTAGYDALEFIVVDSLATCSLRRRVHLVTRATRRGRRLEGIRLVAQRGASRLAPQHTMEDVVWHDQALDWCEPEAADFGGIAGADGEDSGCKYASDNEVDQEQALALLQGQRFGDAGATRGAGLPRTLVAQTLLQRLQ